MAYSTRNVALPSMRRGHGASVALLPGQTRQKRRQDYASLAELLDDNLPKPLRHELANALGIQVKPDERDGTEVTDDGAVEARHTAYEPPDLSRVLAAAHATGNDPLEREMVPNTVWEPGSARAPVIPSMIARAWLYDSQILHHDPSFKTRLDTVFGKGAADQVLAGG
jgi:hypothetical protein